MGKSNTGITAEQFAMLFDRVKVSDAARKAPPILGLFGALAATCKYLRTNRTQADIAEDHGVSQPSISRAVSQLTPLIAEALADLVPDKTDLPTDDAVLIDGTLTPCWSWRSHPELYSGKHHTPGSTSR